MAKKFKMRWRIALQSRCWLPELKQHAPSRAAENHFLALATKASHEIHWLSKLLQSLVKDIINSDSNIANGPRYVHLGVLSRPIMYSIQTQNGHCSVFINITITQSLGHLNFSHWQTGVPFRMASGIPHSQRESLWTIVQLCHFWYASLQSALAQVCQRAQGSHERTVIATGS